jgi:hypothetical protein
VHPAGAGARGEGDRAARRGPHGRSTRLYERLGFRCAPEFDIEIGEMFSGRPLAPGESWQAQAYRLDLGEA